MKSVMEQALGWLGLTDLVAFIPWGKLCLGVVLTVLAVFFPNATRRRTSALKASESTASNPTAAVARNFFRLASVVIGIALLVAAIGDGHQNYVANSRTTQTTSEQEEQNLSSAESNGVRDRTWVRSANKSSLAVTSSPISRAQSQAPDLKWKFLHK